MIEHKFNIKQFAVVVLITSIWVNASEVLRYFLFVMPEIKSFHDFKAGGANMDLSIFMIWGVWDLLLTAGLVSLYWLSLKAFNNTKKAIWLSSILSWVLVFVIFWVASSNMGLSPWSILFIVLPLSLIEMIVGAYISSLLYKKTF